MSDLSHLFGGVARTEEITIGFGKVNFSSTYATYAALKCEAPFKRSSAMTTGQKVSGSDHHQPITAFEHNGSIHFCKVKQEANSVVLLQASWKRNGVGLRDGAVFIRLRPGGPMVTVAAFVPQHPSSSIGDRVTLFIGRGDIMNAEELKVLGIEVPARWQETFMDSDQLAECFEVSEVASETQPRPAIGRIATPDGDAKLVEVPVPPRRRLRVRR